jgi:hypothetical protein
MDKQQAGGRKDGSTGISGPADIGGRPHMNDLVKKPKTGVHISGFVL